MNDVSVGSDNVSINKQLDGETTQVQGFEEARDTEELITPSLVEGGGGASVLEPGETMDTLVMRVVQTLQQIASTGDSFAAIIVNSAIVDEFTSTFRRLPQDIVNDNIKDNLPILADPNVDKVRVITGTDIEMQFLQVRYGPREQGGNG